MALLSPRSALGCVAALVLAACDPLGGSTQVAVLGGAVTVAAPSGYCVDVEQARQAQDTAVVLIGRCLSSGLVAPAVITVSVGPAGSGGVMVAGGAALTGFFSSADGLALLSRSGKAGDVTLLDSRAAPGALLMHLEDTYLGRYWRAITAVNGRLVTISATGTGGVALDDAASLRAVEAALRALQAANPAAPPARPVG
jgi:hypothetical protein